MKYEKLFGYMKYFEDENECWFNAEAGFIDYDEDFLKFIDAVYETDLLMSDYVDYLEQHCSERSELKDYIKTASLELLKEILTYFVRQERFCDGLWARAIKEKVFLDILYRLKELAYV